jgi:hypothetical protein
MNATCRSTSLPHNWPDSLKMTACEYIPTSDWHWPISFKYMPEYVIGLADQCATNVCERDASGYCNVKHAVDRACVCRSIRYSSRKGSSQIFETWRDYVKWLHDLCGDLQDEGGLPEDWHHLAAPSSFDLTSWQWIVRSTTWINPEFSDSGNPDQNCASNDEKFGSILLPNLATILTTYLGRKARVQIQASWILRGLEIAIVQILANWFNAVLVQTTFGFENVTIAQLTLLWCTIPRLTWLLTALIGVQPFETINFSAAAASLLAETILQSVASFYMLVTINYDREHSLYFGGMRDANRETWASSMYFGALLGLSTFSAALVQVVRTTCGLHPFARSRRLGLLTWLKNRPSSTIVEESTA